jgi:amidase
MTTWLLKLDAPGDGPRLAVKDCIDVAGTPTTVGCPVIADRARPAAADAAVVATARRAGARIVGKTNLTELCWTASGINHWSGTPVNPLDASLIPGGSSSGSAVAVATGEADAALGTDTGGSVRIPAACCGIYGLKTTWGRIPTGGVYPLAPSLDTVGPLGRDLAAVELGMRLLEPGFVVPGYDGPMTIGRLRPLRPAAAIAPEIDAAVDAALAAAGFATEDVTGADFGAALEATGVLIDREGYLSNAHLEPDVHGLTRGNQRNMQIGAQIVEAEVAEARREQDAVRAVLTAALHRFPVLALPTLATAPPVIGQRRTALTALTAPINLAGLPALAMPVTVHQKIPVSLQLVGPSGGEETLIAAGRIVAEAVTAG